MRKLVDSAIAFQRSCKGKTDE